MVNLWCLRKRERVQEVNSICVLLFIFLSFAFCILCFSSVFLLFCVVYFAFIIGRVKKDRGSEVALWEV